MPTLDWIGKKAVVNHHREVPYRLIHCDKDKSHGDPDAGNLLVQGDNLEALKALLPYYAGKVKCIYIDPPYNTGNESWVYNDNVNSPEIKAWLGSVVGKEAEDLSRHDKWLCMMYPRLRLLREFLSDDGSIWISIDDNEFQSLKFICDDVFGRANHIANIAWQMIYTTKNSARHFSEMHEYIICYAKKKSGFEINLLRRSAKQDDAYKNPDGDPRGPWKATPLHARNFYGAGQYTIHSPKGIEIVPQEGHTGVSLRLIFRRWMKKTVFGGVGTGMRSPPKRGFYRMLSRVSFPRHFGHTKMLATMGKQKMKSAQFLEKKARIF